MFELDGSHTSWLVYADFLDDHDLSSEGIREACVEINSFVYEPNNFWCWHSRCYLPGGQVVGFDTGVGYKFKEVGGIADFANLPGSTSISSVVGFEVSVGGVF